jgi:hypothetical protein
MRWIPMLSLLSMVACRIGFDPIESDRPSVDAGVDTGVEPACTAAVATCAGDALRTCAATGATPIDQPCAWGCVATGGAHCGQLQPGAFGPDVLTAPSGPLADLDLAGAWITADGGITVDPFATTLRSPIQGEQSGIEFYVHNGVGVYRVKSLHVSGLVHLTQHDWTAAVQPIAIVASGPIVIDALIDGENACLTDNMAAPGGYPGNLGTDPSGHPPSASALGGGGGGNGGAGGAGGSAGGHPIGTLALAGGGGGGGSGTSSIHTGVGGAGGAALQLVSSTSITLGAAGGINAGGCGGWIGNATYGGGGGGAGGTLVLQAPSIEVAGKLAVNGGAGAGTSVGQGANGQLARVAATGDGGAGGYSGSLAGAAAPFASTGGGGGVGRMRFETLHGDVTFDAGAMLSPHVTDVPTTTTAAPAVVE